MNQRSIDREVTVRGVALHTGAVTTVTFRPAPADHGIVFQRADLPGAPLVHPLVANVGDVRRATTIVEAGAEVHTVEHVLSACHGLGVDNVLVVMEGPEPPILDGSARDFAQALQRAGIVEVDGRRSTATLQEAVTVAAGQSVLVALPHDGLRITCTSTDDRGFHTQHWSVDIDPVVFAREVAPARTFTFFEDLEQLRSLGKIRGGSLENALVVKDGQILANEPLRFPDEFVRHKVLDLLGDLLLLGRPLHAHIVATRPGHAANVQLVRALAARTATPARSKSGSPKPSETSMSIGRVMELLPHRYPFVMVDRIVEFRGMDELVALKNVTINEPYFQGHFPGKPVMPGVLQIESMAQAAGILMLRKIGKESQMAFFMSVDKAKFRRAVEPGDQLRIEVRLTRTRANKIGVAEARCLVDGEVVSSAELMFTLLDADSPQDGAAAPSA